MGKRNVKLDFDIWWPERPESWGVLRRYLVPHPGTLIMTLLLVGSLLWAQSAGALPQSLIPNLQSPSSTGTIAYQGRLADSAGNPLTGQYTMVFRLYDTASEGVPHLWEEQWTGPNSVQVSDGSAIPALAKKLPCILKFRVNSVGLSGIIINSKLNQCRAIAADEDIAEFVCEPMREASSTSHDLCSA